MLWGLIGLMGKMKMPDAASALPGRQERMPVPAAHHVNGNPLEPPYPDGMEKAVFGLGCFWGAERCFWQLDGVYTTAVGYAGGHTPNPTYEEVCTGRTGHNEVVLVVFDPKGGELRRTAQGVLGSPRPDPGDAPGETTWERSTGRGSTPTATSRNRPPRRHANAIRKRCPGQRVRPHHHRGPGRRASSTSRRTTTSSTSPRTRGGYCGLGGTGVSCPAG